MKKLIILLFIPLFFNISLFGFSQTNIKAPDGWFSQLNESEESFWQNLETIWGEDSAKMIKNIDKFKDYTLVVSSSKYDLKSYAGVSPTIYYALIKNKLNFRIEDFPNSTKLLLAQSENSGVKDIELIEEKFLNFKNGEKAYKMKISYKIANFNLKIISTNINYFITKDLYTQLTLIGTENDKCTEEFGQIIRELNLIDE